MARGGGWKGPSGTLSTAWPSPRTPPPPSNFPILPPLNPLPRPPFPGLGNAEVNPLRPVYPPLPCDEDVLVEEGVSYRSSARRFAAADQIVVFFSHKSPRAPFSCHKLQLWIYSLFDKTRLKDRDFIRQIKSLTSNNERTDGQSNLLSKLCCDKLRSASSQYTFCTRVI